MNTPSVLSITKQFLELLAQSKFQGDIEDSYGARIVAATDNSVYQVTPQAIVYPKVGRDINHIVNLLAEDQFKRSGLSLVARGGGTGTNGQSLNESLVLDTSRYLNNIIALDEKSMEVVVEPGVVLDQLNAYLADYDLFFPPDVSSSSRATLGGMVATDASGKGSRIYGKTSDYIRSLDVVLSDGSDFCVSSIKHADIDQVINPLAKQAQQIVYEVISQNQDEINRIFPKMNRGLTGYNLDHVLKKDVFQLSYLLAGSEGTLALTKRITLSVIPKPKNRALVVVLYKDFDSTLEHIPYLLEANPTAIEVLDDKILQIAQKDPIWQDVKASFRDIDLTDGIKGLNFIEVTGESSDAVKNQCDELVQIINQTDNKYKVFASLVEMDPNIISSLWGIRKRAVGLLGALEGERQPTAFVEDTAVPPEKLPAYIKDFRAILDSHGLAYGMYGHADVGCLHVRPALDMRQMLDRKRFRIITDQVAELTKKYGGLLWGEHGRGYRGEYSPLFFGDLYPLLEGIKAIFDPFNLFNPGKLSTPSNSDYTVTKIDQPLYRGSYDQQIPDDLSLQYKTAIRCNGNGACFSWDRTDAMCPSYKATKDKRYSPKGRATMLREWLRLSVTKSQALKALEKELFKSLDACLSCKSCTYSCPIKVDIPELKSKFLHHYYKKHRRPLRDYAFGLFEKYAKIGRVAPNLVNILTQNSVSKKLLEITAGIVDTPRFTSSLQKGLKKRGNNFACFQKLSISDPNNTVILLPDVFNASYDSAVLLATYDVIRQLGYHVVVAPVIPNGKALHVKGFRSKFKQLAYQYIEQMERLASTGLPILSVDVVTRLMHQKEYAEILEDTPDYTVVSIESWLVQQIEERKFPQLDFKPSKQQEYTLFPHCMEQTAEKQAFADWQIIFDHLNLPLTVEISGCCGMSGIFGHEKHNQTLSEQIYAENWSDNVAKSANILATGFSCRCQLKNKGEDVLHPIEYIANLSNQFH